MGFISITIVGNLGSDAEMRYTPTQKAVTQFNVAVNNSKPDGQGGWNEKTDWFRCSVWGARAERAAEQLRKGSKVAVTGRFETRDFTDRNGKERMSLEISVDNYLDLSPREARGYDSPYDGPDPIPVPAAPAPVGNADIEDLPF